MSDIDEAREREKLAIQYLRDKLEYSKDSGLLVWLPRNDERWNVRYSGKPAGSIGSEGYVVICPKISGKLYRVKAHRLAWFMSYGRIPSILDHINGVRSDNRLANLREVSIGKNNKNKARYSNNSSGATGVYWHKQRRKWCARLKVNGVNEHIGVYDDFEAAKAAAIAFRLRNGFEVREADHG